jgi:hypothetical protein
MENENSIKFVLSKLLSQYKLNEGYLATQAINFWQENFGKQLKNYVEEVYVKNKILFVRIKSPILRKELDYKKTQIKEEINKNLKTNFILEIRYL